MYCSSAAPPPSGSPCASVAPITPAPAIIAAHAKASIAFFNIGPPAACFCCPVPAQLPNCSAMNRASSSSTRWLLSRSSTIGSICTSVVGLSPIASTLSPKSIPLR